jgi:hypothetical protein
MDLTFDLYSGRPNPSFHLPLEIAAKIFGLISDQPLAKITAATLPSRLGYRGLNVVLPPAIVTRYRVPPVFNIPADTFEHLSLLKDLSSILSLVSFLGFSDLLRVVRLITGLLERLKAGSAPAKSGGASTGPCSFEMLPFDPKPWNDPSFKPTNNCYAYASGKLAKYKSKPQPGVGSGKMFADLSGAEVAAAAKRDGAHDVGDCFPDSEAPRMLVALVIWPGEDYHWYRKHPDCWGHKPGSTDARNVDNANNIISDPQTCDRGPYSEFTGFMLLPNSLKVAA